MTVGGHEEGSGGTREVTGERHLGWKWATSDITDSEGENLEEVAANRKRG